jgi:hypothetical protein
MKKAFKLVVMTLILALCCGNIMVSAATTEDKSSYETPIKQIIEEIGCFEWEALWRFQMDYYDLDEIAYGSSKEWMAEVAALSIPFVEGDLIRTDDYGYGFTDYYAINEKTLKKQASKIFGKKITCNNLWFGERGSMSEAYITNDDGAIAKFECYETETGLYERDFSIKKKGKTYTVTKKVFFGYWGQGEAGEKANYQITYTFKKSTKSDYGFILTGMRIKRI